MAPAEDFAWDESEERDSFSMANITPQLPDLNRHGWEQLEEAVRVWAWQRGTLDVVVGAVLDQLPATIGYNHIGVPKAFWKIISDPEAHQAIAFIMPQARVPRGNLLSWSRPLMQVEALAAIKVTPPIDRTATMPVTWPLDSAGWRKIHRQICR
jgi:endonuclease G